MKKLSLLTLAGTLMSTLSFAGEVQAEESSHYTKEYKAMLEEGAKSSRAVAASEKESEEWKKHKKILENIDRHDRR